MKREELIERINDFRYYMDLAYRSGFETFESLGEQDLAPFVKSSYNYLTFLADQLYDIGWSDTEGFSFCKIVDKGVKRRLSESAMVHEENKVSEVERAFNEFKGILECEMFFNINYDFVPGRMHYLRDIDDVLLYLDDRKKDILRIKETFRERIEDESKNNHLKVYTAIKWNCEDSLLSIEDIYKKIKDTVYNSFTSNKINGFAGTPTEEFSKLMDKFDKLYEIAFAKCEGVELFSNICDDLENAEVVYY